MTSEAWPEVQLGDVAEELTVGHVGSMASEYVEAGIPFLRSQNVQRFKVVTETVKYIRPEFHERLKKSALSPGDVVIVRTGDPGAAAVVPPTLPIANCSDLVIVRPGRKLDARFVAYFVNTATHHVAAHLVGAVQQHFNVSSARTLRLRLPPLHEQRRIAAVLGALDDKIELNRRMNDTLEDMSQAIFKSWFIDFDGHTNFVDSELGRIPRGWAVKSLDEVANYRNGLALQNFRPGDGESRLPVIKIAQLRSGEPDSGEWAHDQIDPECIIEDGDVVFSWSGSLMADIWCGGRGALNQHLFRVTSERYPKWFFYRWTLVHLAEFQAIAADKATTMGHIKRHHLRDARCAVPPNDLVIKASSFFDPLLSRQVATRLENRALTELRDTLLPKLISGEVRVPEGESLAAGARA